MRLPGLVLQGILARSALVFLRLYLGCVFLFSAWLKLEGSVSLPEASFGFGITVGELAVGMTLILGVLTRFSAVAALFISVSYLRSSGAWLDVTGSVYVAHTAISLALLIGAAGRTMGVDAVLARRWPRSPLW